MSDTNAFDQFLSISAKLTITGLVCFVLFTGLEGKTSKVILLAALLFLYFLTYFNSRSYLENFQDDVREVAEILEDDYKPIVPTSGPYSTESINSVDDYEYNMVFENENDKEITKSQRNKLMSQYPMSWTVQPPSSKYFQAGMKEGFEADIVGAPVDISGIEKVYSGVTGSATAPPDMDSIEEKEREIVKTYVPKNANDLKTYDVDDAYKLIKDMYDVKGLIPQVKHNKDTNIYEIVGTRRKDEKITYEDEGVVSNDAVSENGEGVVKVPQAATDMLKDSDPFYNTAERTRQGKFDYTKYTPGLERTFAPSYPLSQWY